MRIFTLWILFFMVTSARADAGDLFFLPSIGLGYNSAQGNSVRLGVDVGIYLDENFYAGAGGYYSAGSRPEHDREMGAGPFLGYAYPVLSFLTFNLREDLDYVDQRTPVLETVNPETYTHDQEYGLISYTYAGARLSFSHYFGISVGYRFALGLSKSSLGEGRSGLALGLNIGI